MRAGHYYRMLQSGPWGVSDPIWGFLSLLAKDAEHDYFYFYQYDHKHYPWIGLLVGLLKVGVHMSAQNISTGANIPNIPKKSKVKIVSNVRMSAKNIFACANILTVETDRMAVRRILWRAIFVRL